MSRRLGSGRLLLRYVVALRGVLAMVAVLVAVLAFLASVAPAALGSFLTDAQRHALGEMVPPTRDLVDEQQATPPADLIDDDWRGLRERLADARADMPPLLRSITGPGMFTLTAVTRQAVDVTPGGPVPPRSVVNVSIDPDLDAHARMVDGELPRPASGPRVTADLVLSQKAAEEMRWKVGEVRELTGSSLPDRLYRLSGVYEAVAPEGPFWRQTSAAVAPVIQDDGMTRTVTATAWVSAEGLDATGAQSGYDTRLKLWYPLAPQRLTAAEGPTMIDQLSAFTRTSVEIAPEHERQVGDAAFELVPALQATFSTQTTSVLRDTQVTADSLTALTALLASGPAAAALCVLVLATGLVRARSAALLSLARARGASSPQLAGGAAVVGLIVGVPAAVIGAAAAAAVVPSDAAVPWWPAVLCGLLPVATAVLAATSVEGRPPRVPRLAVEVTVTALAAAALVAVAQRGLGEAADGVDPLLVAAPVLVCLTGAMLARRLLPLLAGWVATVQRRRTGLVGLLGAARARDDRVSPAGAIALVAALGVATFAGCAVATLDAGRTATAYAEAGADLRVSGPALDPDAVQELADRPEVRSVATLTDGSSVTASDGSSTYATRALTDADALEEVQRDQPGGAVPGLDQLSTPVDDRLPVIVSEAVDDRLDGARDIEVDGDPARVVQVAPGDLPGVPDNLWVLVDRDALGDEVPSYDPTISVLLSLSGDASPELVGEVEAAFPDADVTTPERESKVLEENPAVGGMHTVAWTAAAIAALLVGATVVLVLVAGAGPRTRDLTVVRALGLPARRARALPLWEVGLLVVVAGVVGALVGVVLPLTVLGAIDLRPFTGGEEQPATTFPVVWWVVVAAGLLVVTVGGALLAAGGAARRDLTGALRMMEE